MSSTLFTNITSLVTNDPSVGASQLGLIPDAAFVVSEGVVTWTGTRADAPAADSRVDMEGRTVLPGFVDSHAHLLFAGDRAAEFAARMSGESYSAGGIRSTVGRTRTASDDELRNNVRRLVNELQAAGITTFETKSGYGLDVETEVRSLRIAREFTNETTYLGAHVVAPEYADDPAGYVELVTGDMLDACTPFAKWIDVFCDRGAFDADAARTILRAGIAKGLLPRIHANQLQPGDGVRVAVELGAASADHCTHLSDDDVDLLAQSDTVATLLPGAEFSTRASYPDARRLFEAGVRVALATDCNPGSSYTTNMPFCIAVAVRDMHFTPDQAVLAATLGGAAALRRTDVGHLAVGARADFLSLDAPSHVHLAYRPGVPLVHDVFINGSRIHS
jgi:imidazolonepropionase